MGNEFREFCKTGYIEGQRMESTICVITSILLVCLFDGLPSYVLISLFGVILLEGIGCMMFKHGCELCLSDEDVGITFCNVSKVIDYLRFALFFCSIILIAWGEL